MEHKNKFTTKLLIGAILLALIVGFMIYTPSLDYRVGMCLQAKTTEFPTCGDIKQVLAIGEDKVLIRYLSNQKDDCGFEWEKYLLNRFYKEVPCSCEGLRTCK